VPLADGRSLNAEHLDPGTNHTNLTDQPLATTSLARTQERTPAEASELSRRLRDLEEEVVSATEHRATEIAERGEAEAKLRASEERFALAVRGSSDGIWDWDLGTDEVFYSSRFKELLGYEDDEFVNVFGSFESHLHPDDHDRVLAAVRDHLERHVPYDVEYRLRTKTGEYRCFRARGQAVWDGSGQAGRMAGSITDVTERRQTEEQLRLLSAAVASAGNGVAITNRNGEFVWVNPAFSSLTGYAPEEVIGKTPRVLSSGQTPASVYDDMWATISSGRVWRGELTNRRKDGSLYVDDQVIAPVHDGRGNVTHFVVVRQDITARREAEEALRQSERRCLMMLGQMPAVVWTTDTELAFTSSRGSALAELNLAPDQTVGLTLCEYLQTDDPDSPAIAAHLRALQGERVSYAAQWAGRLYESQVEPMRDAQGTVTGVIGVAMDVTERRGLERELEQRRLRDQQEREIRFDTIVRSMDEGVLVVKPDGSIHFANEAAARLLDQPAEVLLGKPAAQVRGEEEWRRFLTPLLEGAKVTRREELALHTPARLLHLRAQAETVSLPNGDPAGFVCVLTDVTDFHDMSRLKNDMIGFVSHELRRPLSALKGYALTLLQQGVEKVGPETVNEFLREINNEADRLNQLTAQFLDVAKIEAGLAIELSPQSFDVHALVRQVAATQETASGRCAIEVQCAEGVHELRADRDKLLLVLSNLLSNADKYSPQGGTVQVRVTPNHAGVGFAVADQGLGIPQEQLRYLFSAFHRVRDASREGISGTGLGLYLCRHLVEAHGGTMEVESTLGQGSTFSFTIPSSAGAQARV
jgi:PAS domain S-box-containing protein